MKILGLMISRAGAVSKASALGLAGTLGLAGLAVWYLSADTPDKTWDSTPVQEDVVFVAAGPGGGEYGHAGYGEGGEVQSGIRTKVSKDIELMQLDAQRAQLPDEPAVVKQEQQVNAYQMDGVTEGLGMGKNAAAEIGLGGGGNLSQLQEQIAAIQANAALQSKEAAASAGQSAAQAAAALRGFPGQGGGKWGMAEGMARAGGNNLNSAPLDSGHGLTGQEGQTLRAAHGHAGPTPELLAAANRTPGFEGSRETKVRAGKNLDVRDTLSSLQKQSVDVAGNRNRSVNEGTRAFMAGEKLSGGINVIGETVNTGVGSSADFKDPSQSQLGGLQSAVDDLQNEAAEYEEARKDLRKKLWAFIASAAALTLMAFLRWTPWTWGIWAAACAGLITGYVFLQRAINRFEDKWKDKAYKGQYEKGGYHNKATAVAATALGLGILGGIATFTVVIGTMLLINWNAPSYEEPEETPQATEQSVPTSPYGPDVAEDALYLDDNQLTAEAPQK